MSDQDEAETRLYNHTDRLVQGHLRLLADENRNKLLYEALSRSVNSETAVLDIGSGTGIWAVFAALLGAKKVVAIEYEPLLIGLIKTLAEENGVADKVEVILGDSRQIQLEKDFDIVISETVGHLVFDESIVSIMIDSRERFLKPGGKLIPQTVSLVAAPAFYENGAQNLPAGVSLECALFNSLSLNIPLALQEKSLLTNLESPKPLIKTDLRTVNEHPDLSGLTAQWNIADASSINCFAVWAEAELTEEIEISTSRTTSWMPMIYRIKPLPKVSGELKFDLALTNKSNYWTVSFSDGQTVEKQSFSPAFAAAELLARSRSDLVNQLKNVATFAHS